MMKKLSRRIIVIICMIIAVGFVFVSTYHRGSIHGKLTVKLEDSSKTYNFSARGDYGHFEWIIGPKEAPFQVTLFNRNNWHVIDMDFVAERETSSWHITGTVHVKTYEPMMYDKKIPDGEPLVIAVDCFP
jgi:hypothetical protein